MPDLPPAPGFEHHFVETPGLTTHVATIGEGEPVLMLHGFPQHWWQWRSVGAELGRRYRVVCPDLRGAGWTRATRRRIRRFDHRDDILAVMDALGLDRVHLVAHDLGAVVATHLAYSAPDRFRSTVILSVPPPFMPMTPAMLPALRHIPPLLFHRRGRSIAHIFEPPYVATPMAPETIDAYLAPQQRPEIDAATNAIYRWLVFAEMPRMAGGVYRRSRLRVPSLYAFGDQDHPVTADFVRRLCGDGSRYADHFEVAELAGAAHFMTDDQPDEVARLIEKFLARMS